MSDSITSHDSHQRFSPGDFAWVLAVGLVSRFWVFALGWLFNTNFGFGREWKWLLCSFDCGWYLSIIDAGYHLRPEGHEQGDAANWAFFPLFPMLARLVVLLTGMDKLVASLMVSNLAFLAALFVLLAYLRTLASESIARFVVVALAFSPFGVYFSAPYTESLYLLLMVAAMYLARSDRWIAAGLCAAALSATRNLGVFIVFPLLVVAGSQFGWRRLASATLGTERAWLGIALAPLGLAVFMLLLYQLVGDALAFKNVQVAWGGTLENPLTRIVQSLRYGAAYERYCAASACFALVACAYLFRRGFHAEALILLIGTLIPAAVRLTSAPRYVFTLFPIYLALGLVVRDSPRVQWLCLSASIPPGGFMIASWVAQKPYMT